MPTLHREAGFEFFFRAADAPESPHVHVEGNDGRAKIWLRPTLEVAGERGYDRRQMNVILRITREHRDEWLAAWDRFFDPDR